MNKPTLEDAIILACERHRGQRVKGDGPYVRHPLRVMNLLPKNCSEETRIVAVLHDVLEDTEETSESLRERGYSETIIEAIKAVTKRPEEEKDYDAFVQRAAQNEMGRLVKRADLEDNMDLSRISEPTDKDFERYLRYRKAAAYLDSLNKQSTVEFDRTLFKRQL